MFNLYSSRGVVNGDFSSAKHTRTHHAQTSEREKLCVYVCVFLCVFVCVSPCICGRVSVCVFARMCPCVYIFSYVSLCVSMCVSVYLFLCLWRVLVYVCVFVMCVYGLFCVCYVCVVCMSCSFHKYIHYTHFYIHIRTRRKRWTGVIRLSSFFLFFLWKSFHPNNLQEKDNFGGKILKQKGNCKYKSAKQLILLYMTHSGETCMPVCVRVCVRVFFCAAGKLLLPLGGHKNANRKIEYFSTEIDCMPVYVRVVYASVCVIFRSFLIFHQERTHTHKHIHIYAHTGTHTRAHICMHAQASTHRRKLMLVTQHTHTLHTNTRTLTHTQTHMSARIHTRMHTHTYTQPHTYTHT